MNLATDRTVRSGRTTTIRDDQGEPGVSSRRNRLAGAAVQLGLALVALAGGCASTEDAGANAKFKEGLAQAEAGNVEAAIRTLGNGVAEYPDHTRMRFELARLQYETGEAHHIRERQAVRAGARFAEQGRRDEALANRREANDHRAKATPHIQAARENLKIVVDDESDAHLQAWGYYLLMRTNIFFEDWEAAAHDIERAIERGKPTGPLLAQWREYQTGLRDRAGLR
jgi:tetratricopeptide (TPR) repeat protein